MATSRNDQARLGQLAESLNCITEEELLLLAKVTSNTAKAWRKRGLGPSYVLIGNRFLYPRQAVSDYLKTLVRDRQPASVSGL